MKLKNIKYNLAKGLIAAAPMLSACSVPVGLEQGVILHKANYELFVDIDGDNKVDRILNAADEITRNTFYDYAVVGDSISFINSNGQSYMHCMEHTRAYRGPHIRKINGKWQNDIAKWQEMAKRCREAGVECTR